MESTEYAIDRKPNFKTRDWINPDAVTVHGFLESLDYHSLVYKKKPCDTIVKNAALTEPFSTVNRFTAHSIPTLLHNLYSI